MKPSSWDEIRFEDVTKRITYGFTNPMPHVDDGPYIITAKNIRNGKINYENAYKTDWESFRNLSDKSRPKIGTILLTKDGTLGNAAILDKENVCINQSVASLEPKTSIIIPEFLVYVIRSPFIQKIIKDSNKSTTIGHIQITKLSKWVFYLPDIKTQQKIVQKLDYILEQLGEKEKIITSLHENKKKNLIALSDRSIGNIISKLMCLYSPPDSWDIQKLDDVCLDIQPGFAEGRKNVQDGIIHLRMNNIGINFELNFDLIRTVEANTEQLRKYQLKQDDVIFNNTNSSKLVGKSAIFNNSRTCLYSNHLTRLRVNRNIVLPEWLLFYLRGRWLNGDFERMCNKWINQAAVNNNKIRGLEIPLPDIKTQRKIVETISNISTNIAKIKTLSQNINTQIENNIRYFKNLQLKILDQAFSGKLVN